MARAERGLEQLTTEQILTIYEKAFGRLEPIARRRIVAAAKEGGWDRVWESWTVAA